MTTNSAGLSGAKPTMMLTMPLSMSVWVVVSRSHLTKYASFGVAPWNAPCRNSVVHEGADVEPDLRPQRLVVRLEHHPLRAAEQALLDVQRQPAHRDVFPLVGELVGAAQGARAPDHAADHREGAQAVDAERVELAVLGVGRA